MTLDPRLVPNNSALSNALAGAGLNLDITQLSDAAVLADLDGRILTVNAAFTDLTGFQANEVAGQTPRVWKSGEQNGEFYERLWNTISGGRSWRGELVNRRKDGSNYREEMSISPLRDSYGGMIGYLAVKRAIAERLGIGAADAKYRTIFQASRDALLVAESKTGIILDANAAAEKLLGRPVTAIRGMHQTQIHPREEGESARRMFQHHRNTSSLTEHQIQRPDGGTIAVEISAGPMRDDEGHDLVLGIFRDITERREAEENLRASEQRLHAIVNSLDELVVEIDPQGRLERVFGAMPTPFTDLGEIKPGASMEAIVGPELLPQVLEGIQRVFRTGETVEVEAPRTVNRITRWFNRRYRAIRDADGGVRSVCLVARDITQSKESEAQLVRARDAAERANRAKSEFLANMSHEIRTPMNGILGTLDVVLGMEMGREQREFVEMAKSSASALLTIINDILDFSKIEAGKLDLNPVDFSLQETFNRVVKPLARAADQKGIELLIAFSRATPLEVRADPTRLCQILSNLVGNAVKFTHQGQIEVSVDFESTANGDMLHVAVRDTGIGVAEDKQAAIFDAFTQADQSTTRRFGGTGLGLTVSRRLVEMMGGRIWVESQLGEGSCFHFTCRVEAVAVEDSLPVPVAALSGSEVLVVDDNASNRRNLRAILDSFGYRTAGASDATEAVDQLQRASAAGTRFALTLLDSQMPGIDSIALARQLRRSDLPSGPVVMMVAPGQNISAQLFEESAIAAHVAKPVCCSELSRALRRVLGGGEAPDDAAHKRLSPAAQPLNILLAEDHPVNQKLAMRMLQQQGHRVTLAGNGREAVAAAGESSFDLILMDIQMPEMDGIEAAAIICEREGGSARRIPIIAMTAYAMSGDREQCLNAGMDGYVSKPISYERLRDEIARVTALTTPALPSASPCSLGVAASSV